MSLTDKYVFNNELKLKTEEIIEFDASNVDKVLTRFSGEYHDLSILPSLYSGSTEAKALVRALRT